MKENLNFSKKQISNFIKLYIKNNKLFEKAAVDETVLIDFLKNNNEENLGFVFSEPEIWNLFGDLEKYIEKNQMNLITILIKNILGK